MDERTRHNLIDTGCPEPLICEYERLGGADARMRCLRSHRRELLEGMLLPAAGPAAAAQDREPRPRPNNAEVNFEISAADMDALKAAERIRDYGDSSFFPVFGGKL